MTDTEINIAIAECCGWIREPIYDDVPNSRNAWRNTSTREVKYTRNLPNYCHDLNVMHEAEKHLNTALMEPTIYCNELLEIVGEAVSVTNPMAGCYFHIHATARQRAEAFLRTIEKWKE